VKLEQKQREGIAEARSGRRSTVSMRCWQSQHHSGIIATSYQTERLPIHKLAAASGSYTEYWVSVQGSVWGSGLAGIVCAGIALLYGDNSHVWQVWLVELRHLLQCESSFRAPA
jgi:uncharacterized membrane protein